MRTKMLLQFAVWLRRRKLGLGRLYGLHERVDHGIRFR
jgi:hypothetical protein